MKIAILGVTGFIGPHLRAALEARGDQVLGADLRRFDEAVEACTQADAVVNMSGTAVAGKRWSAAHKDAVMHSRVDAPRALIDRLAASPKRPSAYISASAVGYYGTSETATFTESDGPGDDFLASVCVAWEREALRAGEYGMRVGILRTGIVLGKDGGALAQMLPPFRMGAGGIIASGKQWMSWIHLDDIVALYLRLIDGAEGIYNGTAPEPVTNKDFTHALAAAIHRPAIAPVPSFVLSAMFGEGAIVVTKGQRVLPKRAADEGFTFRWPTLAPALESIVA